jgi:sialidase-1
MRLRFVAMFLLMTILSSVLTARAIEQTLLYTVPFKAGDAGARIYRIPALWWLPKKPLLAFAERRMEQRQMHGDIDIVLRRSLDNGQNWEPQQVVADLGKDACGNPCIVQDASNGRLWLAFTRSRQQDIEKDIAAGTVPGTQVWITSSDDDGATWSAPKDISASCRKSDWGWYGTGPGQGLYLQGGTSRPSRILIPSYHTKDGVYTTHCIFSDDHGETWQLGEDAGLNTSEPQVIELDSHTLLMNARAVGGSHRGLFTSTDRGSSWRTATEMAPISDNKCQGYIYRCFRNGSDGQYDWIFSQPAATNRTSVHAWMSDDRGKSWPFAQSLWSGPSAYTAMTRIQGGLVGMLLECGTKDVYEQIAFLKFAPEWLRGRKAPAISAGTP